MLVRATATFDLDIESIHDAYKFTRKILREQEDDSSYVGYVDPEAEEVTDEQRSKTTY